MHLNFEVPVKRCAKGHRIPLNGEVIGHERGQDGKMYPIILKTPRIACEQCALAASDGYTQDPVKHRPVKGKELEKLGQESFLGTAPGIFVK